MSDELKQNEKTETLSNFTEITCRQYLNLQEKSYGFSNLYVYLRAHGRI